MKYEEFILDHAYITSYLQGCKVTNPPLNNYYSSKVSNQGFSPSPLISTSISYHSVNLTSALDPLTQLYTARGSQGFGLDQYVLEKRFGITDTANQWNSTLLYTLESNDTDTNGTTFYTQRPLWSWNDKLVVASLGIGRNIVFSIPMFALFTDQSIDEIQFNGITIQWSSQTNNSMIAAITQEFLNVNPSQTFVGMQN